MSFLEFSDVCMEYNQGKANAVLALKHADLAVEPGDMIAVMGPSGSGKSTLLKIAGCLLTPTQGEYRLGGQAINALSQKQLARIRCERVGFVFQDFCLLPDRNVEENVMVPLLFMKGLSFRDITKKVRHVLERLNIAELARKPVGELSGGQAQRVAIARALVNGPDLILADEPTGALDGKTADEMVGILRELNAEGKTVIIVTHNQKVGSACNRIYTITDGEIKLN